MNDAILAQAANTFRFLQHNKIDTAIFTTPYSVVTMKSFGALALALYAGLFSGVGSIKFQRSSSVVNLAVRGNASKQEPLNSKGITKPTVVEVYGNGTSPWTCTRCIRAAATAARWV